LKTTMKTNTKVLSNYCLYILSLSGLLMTPLRHAFAQNDQDLSEVARSVVGKATKRTKEIAIGIQAEPMDDESLMRILSANH